MVALWLKITVIALWMLNLGYEMAMHDKPKIGKHNAVYSAIGVALAAALFYFGGFFN